MVVKTSQEAETSTFLRNRLSRKKAGENRAFNLALSAYAQEMARMAPTLDNLTNPSEQEQNHLEQIAQTNPHMAKIIQDRLKSYPLWKKRLEGLVMAEKRRQQQEAMDKKKQNWIKPFLIGKPSLCKLIYSMGSTAKSRCQTPFKYRG